MAPRRRSRRGGGSGGGGGESGGQQRASDELHDDVYAIGSKVEVRSDDQGFQGAWYVAEVREWSPRNRLYTVVYSTLLSDEDPSQNLVEVVEASNMRPCPSRSGDDAGGGGRFRNHQLVEALHNDGWWAGVVVSDSGGGGKGYVVCFPSTWEVVEFPARDVRPMLRWSHGQWVEVPDEVEVDAFSPGDKVEVTRDKEYHGATWFAANVVKNIGQIYFLVQYCDLTDNTNNIGKQLEEIVDIQYMRPYPPQPSPSVTFDLHDEVEVFQVDRWLVAVIKKVLPGPVYVVRSKYGEDDLEIQNSDLRLHQEWTKGKWEHVGMKRSRSSVKLSRRGRKADVGKSPNFPITISTSMEFDHVYSDEPHSDSATSKRTRTCKDVSMVLSECSQMREGRKKLLASEEQLADPSLSNRGTLSPADEVNDSYIHSDEGRGQSPKLAAESLVTSLEEFTNEKGISKSTEMDQTPATNDGHPFSKDGNSEDWSMENPANDHADNDLHGSKRRHRRKSDRPIKRPEIGINGPLEWDMFKETERTDDPGEAEHVGEELGTCATNRAGSLLGENGLRICTTSQADSPPAEQGHQICTTNQADSISDGEGLEICAINHADSNPCPEIKVVFVGGEQMAPDNFARAANLNVMSAAHSGMTRDNLKRITTGGLFHIRGSLSDSSLLGDIIQPPSGGIIQPPNGSPEGNRSDDEMDPHLSGSFARGAVSAPGTPDNFHVVDAMDLQETVADINMLPKLETKLPFVKGSPMWQSLDAMEVFTLMPQRPHFHPLEQFSMDFREGMAIGMMVTYANLADNIRKLSTGDNASAFSVCLESLSNLETHGFDVGRLRARVQQMAEIKDQENRSHEKRASMEQNVRGADLERCRLDAGVAALDKLIADIVENLSALRERRDSMAGRKEDADSEISRMQKEAEEMEESCLVAERRFEAVRTAPW